jgi:hypothetical protein
MPAQGCALCGKPLELFPYSWDIFFAAGRNRSAISGYGCGSCGTVICSDCREKNVKWSLKDGFERALCPKCNGAFPPIRVYAERELDAEELRQAVKNLKPSLIYLGASPGKPPSRVGDDFLELGEAGIEALLSMLGSVKEITVAGYAEAARALAERGETRAAAKLSVMLVGDLNSRVVLDVYRVASMDPLLRLDPAVAVKLLSDIVTGERESMAVRIAATLRLGTAGRTESVEPLVHALGNLRLGRSGLVAAAADALGKIGEARAIEPLIAALKISDPAAKAVIVEALGKLNDAKAVEAIRPLLKTDHSGLRRASAVALNSLGWRPSDEKEKSALDKSLPVEKDRYCPSCDRPVGDARSCPDCRAELYSASKSPALAGFLGFLFGNLMGSLVLLVMTLLGAALKYEIDVKIRAAFYGITAVSAWQGMKAKLATARDLAVLKPKGAETQPTDPAASA